MLLGLSRNEPCLCGSGKKFKRCCYGRFENTSRTITRHLRERHPDIFVHPDFVEVLAAACAIAGDDAETPLELEVALAGADRVLSTAFGGDGAAPSEERLMALQELLGKALRSNPELRETRYDPRRFRKVFGDVLAEPESRTRPEAAEPEGFEAEGFEAEVPQAEGPEAEGPEAEGPEAEGPEEPEAEEFSDDPAIRTALKRLYYPGLTEDFALDIYWALRAKPGPDDIAGVLWGLVALCTPGMAHDNPFMAAVFEATLADLAAAEEEMESLKDDLLKPAEAMSDEQEREVNGRFAAYIRRHPLMAKLLSDNIFDRIAEALDAVAGGRIPIRLPVWTMLGGLRFLARRAPSLPRLGGPAASGRGSLDERLQLLLELWEVGLDEDWEAFVPAVQESLRQACAGRGLRPALRASVKELSEQLESDILGVHQLAFQVVYGQAIDQLLRTVPLRTGLPEGHSFRLDASDLLNDAKLRAYAEALAACGQTEAAEHVRAQIGQ